jgi:hypothetical protein
MPRLSPEQLSPRIRVIYRRRVGGLFAAYSALLLVAGAYVAYRALAAPPRTEALEASTDARDKTDASAAKQAVKFD